MKTSFVKSIKKNLKITVAAVLLSVCILPNVKAYATIPIDSDDLISDNYSDSTQIKRMLNDLNCDDSYLHTVENKSEEIFTRQPHNNGEPIYVTISKEYTEQDRELIKTSLDSVFGVVSSVNNLYSYEIVDKAPLDKYSIKYSTKEISDDFDGMAVRRVMKNSGKIKHSTIYLDKDFLKDSNSSAKLYILTHELLHVFGFADIYTEEFENKIKSNTMMNSKYFTHRTKKDFIPLTPNDYRLLLSLYTKRTENEIDYKQKLARAKALIAEYEQVFYKKEIEGFFNFYTYFKKQNIIKVEDNISFNVSNLMGSKSDIEIKVEGSNYKLYQVESNSKKLICQGIVSRVDKSVVLQNVVIPNANSLFYNEDKMDYTGDLLLCRYTKNNQNGGIVLNFLEDSINKIDITNKLSAEDNLGL